MPRPPMPIGTHGEVRCYQLPAGGFRARTKYRDYDGVVREVERTGRTKGAAKDRLREALRDRARSVAGQDVTYDSKLGAVAELWLNELEESDRAIRTKDTYRRAWNVDLKKAVEELRVRELTVSLATRVLHSIRDNAGPGSAKHAKVVLRGMMDLAMRHDAIDTNPVKSVAIGASKKAKPPRDKMTLTEAELAGLRAHLRDDPRAERFARLDLPDLVDGLAALGCRIGELLALDKTKVDFAAGTVAIEGTVIRVKGVGLIVQPHTKSSAGMRTICPPAWFMDRLKDRAERLNSKWLYPSARGTLRDPDNTRAALRDSVAGTSWVGLHPHAFRHLVATVLDAAGLTPREIADYLGHEKVSMTQDVYMNRKAGGRAASRALDSVAPGSG